MSRIEVEGRKLLLNRRQSIHRLPAEARGDLSWRDRQPAQEPATEVTRRELDEIEEALRRIEAGSYGDCEVCGGAMGLQRIRAIPEARFCLTCSGQNAAEE
jgi:DnaK suppressor protein